MKLYKKIQKARVELQNMKLKKSGKNQTINYYELGDFLPAVNAICDKNGLYTHFSIVTDKSGEKAILTVHDTDDDNKITYTTPTAEVALPRGQAIQGLGAKITYLRRYLLMIAFEIVESDMVDNLNRDLTDEVSEEDIKRIEAVKDQKDLVALYNELQKTYKVRLITPYFTKQKEVINQEAE